MRPGTPGVWCRATGVRLAGAWLSFVLACACTRTQPPARAPFDPGEPIGLSLEPREAFEEAMRDYVSELGERRPTHAECERWSLRFTELFEQYGSLLSIAAANAAAVWLRCGDERRAEDGLARLVEAVPRYTIAYNDLAVLRWRRGDHDGAIATLETAMTHVAKDGAPPGVEILRTNLAKMLRLRAAELGTGAAQRRPITRRRRRFLAPCASSSSCAVIPR